MIYFEGESEISKKEIKLLVEKISLPKDKMSDNWRDGIEEKSFKEIFDLIEKMEKENLFLNASTARNIVNSYKAKEFDQQHQLYDLISYQTLKKIQKEHQKDTITFCGGHSLSREDELYFEMMIVGKQLANYFELIFQGGGSGTMEAIYLGACLKGYNEEKLKEEWKKIKLGDFMPEEYKTKQVISICCFNLKDSINPFPQQLICFHNNLLREVALMECSNNVILAKGSHGTFLEMSFLLQQNGNPAPKGYIYDFDSFKKETIEICINDIQKTVEKINKYNIHYHFRKSDESLNETEFQKIFNQGKQVGIEEGKQVGIEEGKQVGIEEGKQEEKEKFAISMIKDGETVEKISKYSGLSVNEIEKLKKKQEEL